MKRRKRRKILQFCSIVIMLAFIAIFVCLIFYKIKDADKEPEYRYYSLSEEATAKAYVWLNQIEDMPLSYTEIKDIMGDIELKTVLTPASEKGKYIQTLSGGTYEECKNKANRGLERAYRQVVKYRISESGYEGEITDEMLDDMMKEAYGLSVTAYLAHCDIELIPTLEEINAMYSKEIYEE